MDTLTFETFTRELNTYTFIVREQGSFTLLAYNEEDAQKVATSKVHEDKLLPAAMANSCFEWYPVYGTGGSMFTLHFVA
jgi:hypothetical protein